MEAELKAAQSDLEEEREKAAMRARRLRGSIRTAQNKVGGVREGFVTFRQEVIPPGPGQHELNDCTTRIHLPPPTPHPRFWPATMLA